MGMSTNRAALVPAPPTPSATHGTLSARPPVMGATSAGRYLVNIPAGPVVLTGDLTLPSRSQGLVLFAHGSGSGRHSPRNRFVARYFNDAMPALATLLVDLLTETEESVDHSTGHLRFDIELL